MNILRHGLGLPNDNVEERNVELRIIGDIYDVGGRLPKLAAKVTKPNSTLFLVSRIDAPKRDITSKQKFSEIEEKLAAILKVGRIFLYICFFCLFVRFCFIHAF